MKLKNIFSIENKNINNNDGGGKMKKKIIKKIQKNEINPKNSKRFI